MKTRSYSRREFIRTSSLAVTTTLIQPAFYRESGAKRKIQVSGHLWVYASAYPPDWNCNPVMDQVFREMKYAGLDGVELMDVNLRDGQAVEKLKALIDKYNFPVTGTSFGAAMWNKALHGDILKDVETVISRLAMLGGKNLGISVGTPGRLKTEEELDGQAVSLKSIRERCQHYKVVPNLHNHTYEVENNLHDLIGTLKRIPDFKLGPDIGWLAKAGVDPVRFIKTYGKQMVYMHLRDLDERGEWTEALGEGVVDFKAVAGALDQINYAESAAIELAFPKDFKPVRPLKDDWKISCNYIRKIFNW